MVRMGFRAVGLAFVTWIVCFVSQGCCEDRGVERDGVDMYGEDGVEMYVEDGVEMYVEDGVEMYIEERDGEGEIWRLRLVFPGSICVL